MKCLHCKEKMVLGVHKIFIYMQKDYEPRTAYYYYCPNCHKQKTSEIEQLCRNNGIMYAEDAKRVLMEVNV